MRGYMLTVCVVDPLCVCSAMSIELRLAAARRWLRFLFGSVLGFLRECASSLRRTACARVRPCIMSAISPGTAVHAAIFAQHSRISGAVHLVRFVAGQTDGRRVSSPLWWESSTTRSATVQRWESAARELPALTASWRLPV